jgi:hypothetical protein
MVKKSTMMKKKVSLDRMHSLLAWTASRDVTAYLFLPYVSYGSDAIINMTFVYFITSMRA